MCVPYWWCTKHAQLIMGTWPIYKKHFLQLILTKKKQQLLFDKISPRDFYFFPFFSICTCHTWIASLSLVFLHKDCYLRLCKRGTIRNIHYETSHVSMNMANIRADSRFAPSQGETALLCNDVSHWLGISLESAMEYDSFINLIYVHIQVPGFIIYEFENLNSELPN